MIFDLVLAIALLGFGIDKMFFHTSGTGLGWLWAIAGATLLGRALWRWNKRRSET
jgi:hypothetical protein